MGDRRQGYAVFDFMHNYRLSKYIRMNPKNSSK